jgi:hypothetical protein
MKVKISSEEAGSIALTPVVVRDMPERELVGIMLGVTGKDAGRIRELLRRGTFVSGASRFRWEGVELDVDALLKTFPDADPSLPFDGARCVRATLRGRSSQIELPCEAGRKKRLFQSGNFWDLLLATLPAPQYLRYSYKEHDDVYRATATATAAGALRAGAKLLTYSVIADQVEGLVLETVDFYIPRE